MIFQRGNPLDYERWAADPGMGTWDYAHCLPYFKRMENCLAAGAGRPVPRPRRAAGARARARRRAPCSGRSSRPCSRPGYQLTDDVNGYRQEGFAPFDRNIHRGRRLSAAARVPASGHGPAQPRGEDARVRDPDPVRGHAGGRRRVRARRGARRRIARGGRGDPVRRRDQLAADPAGLRAWATPPNSGALGIDVVQDLPGVGEHLQDHLEVYIQYACKLPVSVAPGLKWRNRPWIGFEWLFFRRGLGRDEPLRGGRVRPQQRRRGLSEPDVPLPAGRGSLRRLGAGRRPRLPGAHRSDVLRLPGIGEDPSAPTRGSIRRCGSTTSRRPRTGASGWRRSAWRATILNQPAFEPFNGGELSPGPGGRDRRADPGLGAQRRRDRAAPLVHVPDGRRRPVGHGSADDARPRRWRGCGWWMRRHALHHQREHLRAR